MDRDDLLRLCTVRLHIVQRKAHLACLLGVGVVQYSPTGESTPSLGEQPTPLHTTRVHPMIS